MKTRCEWCGTEDVHTTLSDDGDNCCGGCICDANDNAKPIKESNDIHYLQKDELIDFAIRSGAPMEVAENLQELVEEEEGQVWENIEEIWPDYPSKEDFFFNEDEY